MPTELELKAAADLGDILADIAGRPLTAEERARTHQHVAMVCAMLDAGAQEPPAEGFATIHGDGLVPPPRRS